MRKGQSGKSEARRPERTTGLLDHRTTGPSGEVATSQVTRHRSQVGNRTSEIGGRTSEVGGRPEVEVKEVRWRCLSLNSQPKARSRRRAINSQLIRATSSADPTRRSSWQQPRCG